jgi:hypothetical protein
MISSPVTGAVAYAAVQNVSVPADSAGTNTDFGAALQKRPLRAR